MNPQKKSLRQEFVTDQQRWNAVVSRNEKADERFRYSVKTTGIYCRPTCSARLPRRENVRFHKNSNDAKQAGFRPCQRCRPDGDGSAKRESKIIAQACRVIEQADAFPSLQNLAQMAGWSPHHFHRVFKKITGLTPKSFAVSVRARRLRAELPKSSSVTRAIYEAGFNSSGRFYAKASKMLGMRAKNFQNGGSGEKIRFAVGQCSLGAILIAATEIGLCAISLGDDPNVLLRELKERFPKAQRIGGNKDFQKTVAQVVAFVDDPKIGLNLPLDLRGTTFQQRVWEELDKTRVGTTVTYTEIAMRIGSPTAVRAVAGACAANVIAVAVPCHRVVRKSGELSGYRWGVQRKQALLAKEKSDV